MAGIVGGTLGIFVGGFLFSLVLGDRGFMLGVLPGAILGAAWAVETYG